MLTNFGDDPKRTPKMPEMDPCFKCGEHMEVVVIPQHGKYATKRLCIKCWMEVAREAQTSAGPSEKK